MLASAQARDPCHLPTSIESITKMSGPNGDACEIFCHHAKTRLPGEIIQQGDGFYRVQVSVHAVVRFIAFVHLSDTNVPTGWSCLRPVSQSDGETRVSVSGRDLFGSRVLTIGDYCEVFINTYKTWLQGVITAQGPDFLTVVRSLDDRPFCVTVSFG